MAARDAEMPAGKAVTLPGGAVVAPALRTTRVARRLAVAVAAFLAAAAAYVAVVPKSCERFVVISQQRSGSTYLVEALDAHPDLGCVDEIFAERSGTDTGDWSAVDAKWEDTFSRQCPRGWWAPRAVGFKWMTNQGHDELHARVLAKAKATGTRVIFLFRRNELRREVSAAVNLEVGGEARGLAHPATDAAAQLVRARRVKLRAGAELVNELARKYEERARVAAYYAASDSLFVDYEDLLGDGADASLARIHAFLGVAHVEPPASRLHVLHQDRPILAAVENAAAVRETMALACAPPPPGRPALTFGGGCDEALGEGACVCEDGPCSCESSAPDGLGAVLRRALEDARDRYAAARRALAASGDATAAAAVVEEAERLEREASEAERLEREVSEAERLEREVSEAKKFETEVSERLAALARDSSKAPRCEDNEDCGYFEQCINSRCVGATLDEEQIETRSFAAAVAWAQRKQASSPYRRWLTSRDGWKTDATEAQWETASELNRMTSLHRRQLEGGAYSHDYSYEDLDFSEPMKAPEPSYACCRAEIKQSLPCPRQDRVYTAPSSFDPTQIPTSKPTSYPTPASPTYKPTAAPVHICNGVMQTAPCGPTYVPTPSLPTIKPILVPTRGSCVHNSDPRQLKNVCILTGMRRACRLRHSSPCQLMPPRPPIPSRTPPTSRRWPTRHQAYRPRVQPPRRQNVAMP